MINLNEEFLSRMKLLLKDEYDAFLHSLSQPSEKSIYINENKISTNQFSKVVDFDIKPIKYEKAGFYVEETKLGRHPLHHAGAFYIQEPSAMFTVNAYNFKGDEKVLDMCASPGGKSIQIANRIPNGVLVSNEINKKRSEILYSNIERMGLKNVVVTNETPENIANAYANSFDFCLVDAPCSAEGMLRKGEEIATNWNSGLNELCAKRQIEILDQANRCLKNGGILIYSTCTYSKLENEDVVNEFISKHKYELVKFKHEFTKGIGLEETARLYPHVVKGEGQFVAVLRKLEENNELPLSKQKLQLHKKSCEFAKKEFNLDINCYEYKNYSYYIKDQNFIKRNVNYTSLGVRLFNISQKDIEPFHNIFTAFGREMNNKLCYSLTSPEVKKYLRGETIEGDFKEGFGAFMIENCAVGGYKISKGKFKNYYPKGLRNF